MYSYILNQLTLYHQILPQARATLHNVCLQGENKIICKWLISLQIIKHFSYFLKRSLLQFEIKFKYC